MYEKKLIVWFISICQAKYAQAREGGPFLGERQAEVDSCGERGESHTFIMVHAGTFIFRAVVVPDFPRRELVTLPSVR